MHRSPPRLTPLPACSKKIYTVLRSPHVNKDSREQFEVRLHQRLIDIKDLSSQTVDKLMALDLPAGVDVEVRRAGRAAGPAERLGAGRRRSWPSAGAAALRRWLQLAARAARHALRSRRLHACLPSTHVHTPWPSPPAGQALSMLPQPLRPRTMCDLTLRPAPARERARLGTPWSSLPRRRGHPTLSPTPR